MMLLWFVVLGCILFDMSNILLFEFGCHSSFRINKIKRSENEIRYDIQGKPRQVMLLLLLLQELLLLPPMLLLLQKLLLMFVAAGAPSIWQQQK